MPRYALVVVVETDDDADPVLLWETAAQDLELGGGGEAIYLSDPYKIEEPFDARGYEFVSLSMRNPVGEFTVSVSALKRKED